MNTRRTMLALLVGLTCVTLGYAQPDSVYPHMGVLLDPMPLPELLTKHLGLKPDQGIRIQNINVGSPADKIGLERDDIIVAFQGQDIKDVQQFVQAVRTAGTEDEISLQIIHLGQRKTLQFKLALPTGSMEFKYPAEPQMVTSWRPGEIFQLDPNEGKWLKMSLRQMPDVDVKVKNLFKEQYSYRHATDGQDYTVTIEGDPAEEQTEVIVEAGQNKYSATVGSLDDLPEEYRAVAKDDVAAAVKAAKSRARFHLNQLPKPPAPEDLQLFLQNIPRPQVDMEQWNDRQQRALDRMQQQMERLQQRMEEMEKRLIERFDTPPDTKGDRPAGKDDQTGRPTAGTTT